MGSVGKYKSMLTLRDLEREDRFQILLAAALGIAFAVYLLTIYLGNLDTEVMRDRFWKNAEPLFDGEVPIMEYPPFALLFFAIPRLFTDTPSGYNALYVVETFIFVLIGLIIVRKIAAYYNANQVKAMVTYSVLIVMFLQFVADRYDIIPAIMTLGALYLLISKRAPWAFMLLALAMMTKLYPAIFLPLFLMIFFVERDWKGLLSGLAVFVLTALAVVAVAMAIDPEMIFSFMNYHMDRPLEIGCVVATVIYPFAMVGLTTTWILPATSPGSFGSDDLMGPWPDAVAPFLTPIMAIAVVGCIILYGFIRKGSGRADERMFLLLGGICISLLAFIILGKVFSSQYIIWIIPFLALLVVMSQNRTFRDRLLNLTLLSFALTQINFAYIYGFLGGGTNINDISMISMLVRNLMVVAIMVMIAREMVTVGREHFTGEDMGEEVPFKCRACAKVNKTPSYVTV